MLYIKKLFIYIFVDIQKYLYVSIFMNTMVYYKIYLHLLSIQEIHISFRSQLFLWGLTHEWQHWVPSLFIAGMVFCEIEWASAMLEGHGIAGWQYSL